MEIETQRMLIRDITMDDVEDLHEILGYAYEACKAVMDYAFRELNAHKIFAKTIDSIKSVGLMEKLGMRQEGIQQKQVKDNDGNWADFYLYGLLKEEWKSC